MVTHATRTKWRVKVAVRRVKRRRGNLQPGFELTEEVWADTAVDALAHANERANLLAAGLDDSCAREKEATR